jgi:hypothetical protein
MLWPERVSQFFPVGKEHESFGSFLVVRFARFLCFASVFWVSGVLACLITPVSLRPQADGFTELLLYFSAVGFLVFAVSGWFENRWNWFFDLSSRILRLNESEFSKFRVRMERFITSFLACFLISLCFSINYGLNSASAQLKTWGLTAFWAWLVSVNLLLDFFYGTLLWMILSLWITLFLTFRQPLKLKLSSRTNEEFRPLAIWGLKILLLTFTVVALWAVFIHLEILEWAWSVYLAGSIVVVSIGVLAFLLPFHHVHRALVKLKKQELLKIEEESNLLMQDLTKNVPLENASVSERMVLSRLVSLQTLHIKEMRIKEVDEWPIGITILSAVAGLVLIPILVNIITNFL